MKKQRLLACALAGVMVLSMTACDKATSTSTPEAASTSTEVSASVDNPAPAKEEGFKYDDAASITFADGNFAFFGSDATANPAAKTTAFELVDRNGQKAVKITSPDASKMFAGIQMDALLGDKIGDVKTVELVLESECTDGGKFVATSGNVYSFLGEDKNMYTDGWSIYLEKSNPKTVSVKLQEGAVAGNYLVLSLEVNDGSSYKADRETALYVYSISFKDANGNVLAADSSAEYVAISTGADRTNLFGISDAITTALAGADDGWSQIGYVDLTEEEFAMLQAEGSVVEIEYSAATGNMWMGLNGDNNGWKRIGVGDCDGSGQGYAYYNNSRTICQVTHEDIAAVCGDDVSKWDKNIFFESDGAFEVFSVKIGKQAPSIVLMNAIEVEGFSGTADGWAQIGYDIVLSEEAINMLKTPGSVVAVEYASATDDLWIGLSGNAWNRVGDGTAAGGSGPDAITNGSVCYVTYDMIAAVCGEDTSAWDTTIFVESNDKFEVFSVKVGMAGNVPANRKQIDIGLSGTADGWAQIGYDVTLSDEAIEMLKTPGSVIAVQYASATGDLWVGLSGNAWNRVGDGTAAGGSGPDAITDGNVCYVTYDMIAAVCGEDSSAWDTTIFVESNDKFEVFSVTVGTK